MYDALYNLFLTNTFIFCVGVFDSLSGLSIIPGSRNSVSLDPNHNVFFLYDNGTTEQFGQETLIRSHFEQV